MYQIEFYRRGLKTLVYRGCYFYVNLLVFCKLYFDKSISGYSLWRFDKRLDFWSNLYYKDVNNG